MIIRDNGFDFAETLVVLIEVATGIGVVRAAFSSEATTSLKERVSEDVELDIDVDADTGVEYGAEPATDENDFGGCCEVEALR